MTSLPLIYIYKKSIGKIIFLPNICDTSPDDRTFHKMINTLTSSDAFSCPQHSDFFSVNILCKQWWLFVLSLKAVKPIIPKAYPFLSNYSFPLDTGRYYSSVILSVFPFLCKRTVGKYDRKTTRQHWIISSLPFSYIYIIGSYLLLFQTVQYLN